MLLLFRLYFFGTKISCGQVDMTFVKAVTAKNSFGFLTSDLKLAEYMTKGYQIAKNSLRISDIPKT